MSPRVVGLNPQGWEDDHDEGEQAHPEQAVRKVREGERMLGSGSDLTEVLRHLEITESTWHRWGRAYGGMSPSHARRLKELEVENARLKKLLGEAELDKAMLKELAKGQW